MGKSLHNLGSYYPYLKSSKMANHDVVPQNRDISSGPALVCFCPRENSSTNRLTIFFCGDCRDPSVGGIILLE